MFKTVVCADATLTLHDLQIPYHLWHNVNKDKQNKKKGTYFFSLLNTKEEECLNWSVS